LPSKSRSRSQNAQNVKFVKLFKVWDVISLLLFGAELRQNDYKIGFLYLNNFPFRPYYEKFLVFAIFALKVPIAVAHNRFLLNRFFSYIYTLYIYIMYIYWSVYTCSLDRSVVYRKCKSVFLHPPAAAKNVPLTKRLILKPALSDILYTNQFCHCEHCRTTGSIYGYSILIYRVFGVEKDYGQHFSQLHLAVLP
jgi:hypothetical protein